jgi:hypothetical protein
VLEQQTVAFVNRIHRLLEDANIKLGVVASDIVGVSGRAMLRALIAGETDATTLANLARRQLRRKIPQLQQALAGRVTTHHGFLLERLLNELEFVEREIAAYNRRITDVTQPAAQFYEQSLGLTREHSEGEYVITYHAGSARLLVYQSQYAGTNQATSVTWTVGDVDGTVRDLKSKGVRFEHYDMPNTKHEGDVHVQGGRRVAWFKDPDGNIHAIGSR